MTTSQPLTPDEVHDLIDWPIAASAGRAEPDPDAPFYRGQHVSGECDYMPPGATTCCDAPPAYEVWWKPVPELDLDTKPVSATCQAHVVAVDRRLVEVIRTHPVVTASRNEKQSHAPSMESTAPTAAPASSETPHAKGPDRP